MRVPGLARPGREGQTVSTLFRSAQGDFQVEVSRALDGLRVVIGGTGFPWPVSGAKDGSWLVDTPAGRRRLWVDVQARRCLVFMAGRVVEFQLPDPHPQEEGTEPPAGPRLLAEMPGKIVQVAVSPGDRVAAGQTLVIMESMKMETELGASVEGLVRMIHVEVGQVVGQGDLLVEITPDPSG